MKKIFLFVFVTVLVILIGGYYIFQNTLPVSSSENFKDFLITKGSSASLVANNLYKEGLIKNPLVFKVYTRLTGKSGSIQPGEYRLSPHFSLFDLLTELDKGPTEIWITIPEGLRREEIAVRYTQALKKDQVFIDEFLNESKEYEGYLFPETYLFQKDVTAKKIVEKMQSTFETETANLNLSRDQVILASLIERETKTDSERPIVAGIMMNRLEVGMALQIDAAVQYAVGTSKNWWPILTRDDLASSSPYNTYKFAGLPPSPIANAGLSSLMAAANPSKTDYWYYIHGTDGVIRYASTLSEHNENIRKYLGK